MHKPIPPHITSTLRNLVLDGNGAHFQQIKIALWLYLYLVLSLNPETGKVLFDPRQGEKDTGIREETLRSWLGHLRRGGYLSVKKQDKGFLVKVSGTVSKRPKKPSIPEDPLNSDNPKIIPNEVGKANVLAHEIADEFKNGSNLEFYQVLCEDYPLDVINRAFAATKAVPERQIRKSRGALFTYLVKKYAQEK